MFSDTLYYICLRYTKNVEVAQDVMHDGFIIIFKEIGSYRGDGSFEGWIKRIMVTTALAHLRKVNKERNIFEQSNDIGSYDKVTEELKEEKTPLVSMDKVLRLLDKLPLGSRTVFNLYFIEGYTHKQIAVELKISEGTSKSQLSRAKELLKLEIKKEGGAYVV